MLKELKFKNINGNLLIFDGEKLSVLKGQNVKTNSDSLRASNVNDSIVVQVPYGKYQIDADNINGNCVILLSNSRIRKRVIKNVNGKVVINDSPKHIPATTKPKKMSSQEPLPERHNIKDILAKRRLSKTQKCNFSYSLFN